MATVVEAKDRYAASFEVFSESAGGGDWLRDVRRQAFERFSELGFPTKRDEDWKFTNVAPIASLEFERANGASVDAADLGAFRLPDVECSRLVFVDGRYAERLSTLTDLPEGVLAGSLADAIAVADGSGDGTLERHLARYADYRSDAFTALNTAFIEDGGVVHVPRGVVVEQPVHLLFVSSEAEQPTITHPRTLIVAEEQSQITVVEEYVSLGGGVHFSNVVTELVAGDNAVVSHYVIERENEEAFNVGTLRVQQGRTSNVASHSVLLGGRLVRNNVHPVMGGEGGYCLINGLFMPHGRQHMDNFMWVEHASPHCDSRQFYNGILSDRSHGVFSGRIVVHKDAQKTDAKQTNRNLLLSGDARIDSKPQLEIYADDVKCTHGATIGQIDPDAVFYLCSRGISEDQAREMLLYAFAGENLDRMECSPVRAYAEALVAERLPAARPRPRPRL